MGCLLFDKEGGVRVSARLMGCCRAISACCWLVLLVVKFVAVGVFFLLCFAEYLSFF